jgi:hypothetical protein
MSGCELTKQGDGADKQETVACRCNDTHDALHHKADREESDEVSHEDGSCTHIEDSLT